MRRRNNTPRWSGFLGTLVLGALFFPVLSLAATVTYSSNKVMGPTNGLVGYWTMNAQDINWTTNTILDRSGLGNNGILTNMATKTSPYTGKIGQALLFDYPKKTTETIRVFSTTSLDNLSKKTISFWMRPRSPGGGGAAGVVMDKGVWTISYWGGSFQFRHFFSVNDGEWRLVTNPKYNAWHHLVITYDKSSASNDPAIYVDGVLATLTKAQTPSGSAWNDSSMDLLFGNTGGTREFDGALDDIRFYNRILTPTEIKQLYNVGQVQLASTPKKNTSGLVGWWTFDGPDVNWTTGTALDRSGQGNNGTLLYMATKTSPVAGKIGQGLKFDGTEDVISSGSAASLDDIDRMSISMWVNARSTGINFSSEQGNFMRKGVNDSFNSWGLQFDPAHSKSIRFRHAFSGTDGFWNTGPIKLNQWYHLTMTYDRTSSANAPTFYINGQATTTNVYVSPVGTADNDASSDLMIGGRIGGDRNFDGSMDDVRIYNRILTAAEVAKLYKEGQVTVNSFTCGQSTVKDVDGNIYHTVKIGAQCWMKENMRVGTRINGATNQTNNGIIEKYCYNDTASNCTTNHPNYPDGGLYQWDEAMQYSTTPGAQGICPSGWHIPTHDQFTTLERAVCTSGSCATDFPFNTTTTGERGTGEEFTLTSGGSSGYEMNISGKRSFVGGSFMFRNSYTYFWSSTDNFGTPWFRRVSSGLGTIFRDGAVTLEGYSVRCLKN